MEQIIPTPSTTEQIIPTPSIMEQIIPTNVLDFFAKNSDARTVFIPNELSDKSTPKKTEFDYAKIVDGMLNGVPISRIIITHCSTCNIGCLSTSTCTGHSISIESPQSDYFLNKLTRYKNNHQNFTYDELQERGYLPYIYFVVSFPDDYFQKCSLAKMIGKDRILYDYDDGCD